MMSLSMSLRSALPWFGTFLAMLSEPLSGHCAFGGGKVHVVGKGLEMTGELGKNAAVTYQVKVDAGKTYVINMISADHKALDPFLRLLDAIGKQLAEDDDGGEGLNARLIFKG